MATLSCDFLSDVYDYTELAIVVVMPRPLNTRYVVSRSCASRSLQQGRSPAEAVTDRDYRVEMSPYVRDCVSRWTVPRVPVLLQYVLEECPQLTSQ